MIVESNVQALPGKWAMPSPLLALVAPDVGMERVARRERVLLPFLFAVLCSLLAAAASSYRVDARDATLATLERTGQLKTMSDRQIEDQTKDAERTYVVKTVAVGAVGPVVKLGLLCVGLLALSWFVRGRAKGKALAAVAAVAMLPGAIENLLAAGAALGRRSIPPDGPPLIPADLASMWTQISGHPVLGPASRLLGAFDVFSLWGALLAGYGLATAANLPLRRAMTATLVGWLCVHVLLAAATGAGGPGPHGGGHP
ncbi:MAG: YIP1 family protein [Myxococcales bacterium]